MVARVTIGGEVFESVEDLFDRYLGDLAVVM